MAAATCDGVSAADLEFLGRFEECSLTESEWTHEAHVRVAWVILNQDAGAAAVNRIRHGIQQFNARVLGRPGQYHETVTLAFAAIIRARLSPGESFQSFLARSADVLSREEPVLLEYYSPERLKLAEARESFVAPDRRPLPSPGSQALLP